MANRDHSWYRCMASQVCSWLFVWAGWYDGWATVGAVDLRFSAESIDETFLLVLVGVGPWAARGLGRLLRP